MKSIAYRIAGKPRNIDDVIDIIRKQSIAEVRLRNFNYQTFCDTDAFTSIMANLSFEGKRHYALDITLATYSVFEEKPDRYHTIAEEKISSLTKMISDAGAQIRKI